MNRQCLKAVLALAMLLTCAGAWAQECQMTTAGVNFGEYNPLDNHVQHATGMIQVACNNPTNIDYTVEVCIGLREGSAGSSVNNRRMLSANNGSLSYQLYRDPALTSRWGLVASGEFTKDTGLIPAGTTRYVVDRALYGRIPAGQQGTIPGNYASNYTFPDQIEFVYTIAPGEFEPCEGLSSNPASTVMPFTITASVPDKCGITVGPTDLDFGTVIGLEVPALTKAFGMRVRCTKGTSYRIALNDGQFPNGPGRRRMRGTDGFIDYEIFQDSGLTTRWGMTPGGATRMIMAPLTGTAADQGYIGYGHVPAQIAPGIGTYQDKVIVTVEY